MSKVISASLVLYENSPEVYSHAITSFLNGVNDGVLVISDNSKIPLVHPLFNHSRVIYIFNDANLGFGAAHNVAIAAIPKYSHFHLILNPDIRFDLDVIRHLVAVMESNAGIGALMPRINFPDGSLQRLCKLLPTPINLIFRRFIPIKSIQNKINTTYELYDLPQDKLIDVPMISGCFLLVRTDLLKNLRGFDERYFMYLEDVDLIRRIGDVAKVTYDPRVSVTHDYAKGSYRNLKLLGYHLTSAIRYFNRWGWLFDLDRKKRNESIRRHIKDIGR